MTSETEPETTHGPPRATAESPSEAVIRVVAAASNEDPVEMDPLYTVVDPDALDALCTSSGTDPDGNGVTVEFGFNDHRVRVSPDGGVSVLGRE